MRLAIISDIHGNLTALEAVLADLKMAGGADKTWVLGDLCVMGSRPAECLSLLRDLKHAEFVSGNTDRRLVTGERGPSRPKDDSEWEKWRETIRVRDETYSWTLSKLGYADYDFLAKLRKELDLYIPDYGWAIGYHGTPGDDEGYIFPDTPADEALDHFLDREGRLGFGGHTHRPMDRDLGLWRLVNVGSVGIPFDEARACYALVTFENGTATIDLRRVSYDVEAMLADLQASGNPSWAWAGDLWKRG